MQVRGMALLPVELTSMGSLTCPVGKIWVHCPISYAGGSLRGTLLILHLCLLRQYSYYYTSTLYNNYITAAAHEVNLYTSEISLYDVVDKITIYWCSDKFEMTPDSDLGVSPST